MSQVIDDMIYAKLTASTASTSVYGLTSGRIFNGMPAQETDLPYVSFTVVTDTEDDTFTKNGAEVDVQVNVVGDKALGRKAVRAINEKVWTLLHHTTATATGYHISPISCTNRGVVDDDEDSINIRSEYNLFLVKTS